MSDTKQEKPDATLVSYPFLAHKKRLEVREYHWRRKRGKPKTLFAELKTWEIGGVHFSADGWIYPQVLTANYVKGKPTTRRIHEFDMEILWALALAARKNLGGVESELAGRVHTDAQGKESVYVFYRQDVIDSLRRLQRLGIVRGVISPAKKGKEIDKKNNDQPQRVPLHFPYLEKRKRYDKR